MKRNETAKDHPLWSLRFFLLFLSQKAKIWFFTFFSRSFRLIYDKLRAKTYFVLRCKRELPEKAKYGLRISINENFALPSLMPLWAKFVRNNRYEKAKWKAKHLKKKEINKINAIGRRKRAVLKQAQHEMRYDEEEKFNEAFAWNWAVPGPRSQHDQFSFE